MNSKLNNSNLPLREVSHAKGFGLMFAFRTRRAWWYSAWLRTLARFSRTYFGSFWLGLSNLLSVAILGFVYGTVFKIPNPWDYLVYLGLGYTIWGFISLTVISSCGLLFNRRDQLINNSLPSIFYCLEEWSFQVQTFSQSFGIVLIALAAIKPQILVNTFISGFFPILNLILFCFWITILMALLGARFKDFGQLVPILMQLTFLVSPILYQKDGLGRFSLVADLNPFYRILAPVRTAAIDAELVFSEQMITLIVNLLAILLVCSLLKRFRYDIPFWV